MQVRIFALALAFCCLISVSAFSQKSKKNKKTKDRVGNTATVLPDNSQPNPAEKEAVINPTDAQPNVMEWLLEELEKNAKPVVEEKTNGIINWTEQFIEARGESVIDVKRFGNEAQARLMAQRGAVVIAQRNLLEIIKGVHVTSETTVQDMITTSDFIYTRIEGVIKGAQMVGEPMVKDGTVSVRMRVPIYANNGLAPQLYEEIPSVKREKKQPQLAPATTTSLTSDVLPMTAFSFNLGGKKFNPAMFPVIVDENNQILLDLTKIYDPRQGNFPKYLQLTKQAFEAARFQKGIELLQVIETHNGKIKISKESAKKVNWKKVGEVLTQISKFLILLL